MQSDKYAMAEKILRDVETAVTRDEDLQEFMIIPVSLNQNKSPVVHVEHNLGLESWCVKHVYTYAYKRILAVRQLVAKRKLLHEEYGTVHRLLLGALLINPDVSTFWNMRRELVTDALLSTRQELRIARVVLSHKSKSNEAFAYRKWLLRAILASERLDKAKVNALLDEELRVCTMTAAKSPNNYHAWCHRIWCLEHLLAVATVEMRADVLAHELRYTESWLVKHVSEHTGFHYRQYVLGRVRGVEIALADCYASALQRCFPDLEPDALLQSLLGRSTTEADQNRLLYQSAAVLVHDLQLNADLHETFPEHETLWCHRRYTLYSLFALVCTQPAPGTPLDLLFTGDTRECNVVDRRLVRCGAHETFCTNGERFPKILKCERNPAKLYRMLVAGEKTLVERYVGANNRQGYLAQRHEKWLAYILGLARV